MQNMQKLDQSKIKFTQNKNENQQKTNKSLSKIRINEKCIGNNNLSLFCINPKCQSMNSKFMCNDLKCKCNEKHFQCIRKSIDYILIKIDEKICKDVGKMRQNISQIFTKLIDKISQFEQNCLKQVDNQLKFYNVTDLQLKFYQIFVQQKEQNLKQFDNQQLQQLQNNCEENKKNQSNSYFFTKYMKQIQDYYNKFIQSFQLTKIKFFNIFQTKNIKSKIMKSSIMKNDVEVINLMKFFNKRVKSVDLVFKASQNDFEMEKYYQKCGNLQNTIILCENENDKILGGYTPFKFNQINNLQTYEQITDYTGQSFLFSLTNNHKFQLKSKQHFPMSCRTSRQYIAFGNYYHETFVIKNNANHYQGNKFHIENNNNYYNQNYGDNEQSYLKLIGNQDPYFQIKQWEVLKVQFQ